MVAFSAAALPAAAQDGATFDWSGFSTGVYAGGAWGTVNADQLRTDSFGGVLLNDPSAPYDFNAGAFNGGVQAGYDVQRGNIVYGVGAEFGWMPFDEQVVDLTTLPGPVPNAHPVTTFSTDFQGAITGRVGYAFDNVLVYGRAGVAFVRATGESEDSCGRGFCGVITVDANGNGLVPGYTLGAGAEMAFNENWSIGAEYRFADYGSLELSGIGSNGLEYHQDLDLDAVHAVRVFLNYRW